MTRGGILPCKLLVLYEPRRGGGEGGSAVAYKIYVMGARGRLVL